MTSGVFPADASSRKAILILSEHDYEKCSYTKDASKALLDQEAYVIAYPLPPSADRPLALKNIEDSGLLRPGVILVQSPYDTNCYEDVLDAPQRFALVKHMYFSQLCMLLGAKEVQIKQISDSNGKATFSLDIDGNYDSVGTAISTEHKELNELKSQMHLHDKFSGAPANLVGAEKLLRDAKLWNDITMRTLLDMRPGDGNKIIERTLTLNLSTEARTNISIAARINVPGVTLSADYASETVQKHEFKLMVKVQF